MKLCRYDDDRLGIVRGDLVHDVTPAQTEIRNAAPYAMTGDAVIAALPQWRERLERLADKAPGKALAQVKLQAPVARPSKLSCAPTNYQAHINEMAAAAAQPGSQMVTTLIYDCRRLIEFASSFYTLYPGDLIYTGTPEGVGPVKPGDVIVCRLPLEPDTGRTQGRGART